MTKNTRNRFTILAGLLALVAAIAAPTASLARREGGDSAHGGNHLRTRFVLAREIGLQILGSRACEDSFGRAACAKMHGKLDQSPLAWHSSGRQGPLKALLNGQWVVVTAVTTPKTCRRKCSIHQESLEQCEVSGSLIPTLEGLAPETCQL